MDGLSGVRWRYGENRTKPLAMSGVRRGVFAAADDDGGGATMNLAQKCDLLEAENARLNEMVDDIREVAASQAARIAELEADLLQKEAPR